MLRAAPLLTGKLAGKFAVSKHVCAVPLGIISRIHYSYGDSWNLQYETEQGINSLYQGIRFPVLSPKTKIFGSGAAGKSAIVVTVIYPQKT